MYDLFDRFTGEENPTRAASTGMFAFLNDSAVSQLAEPSETSKKKTRSLAFPRKNTPAPIKTTNTPR
jgi:hypothetical protein